MNQNQVCDKEPALLLQKASQLKSQNNSIEDRWKDLYGIAERLNTIAKRLNSVNHPDNAPKDPNKPYSGTSGREATDGIIGSLDEAIATKGALLNEFDNNIHRLLVQEVDYIERYI